MVEKLCRRWLNFREIGWAAIGETFTRYTVLKTRWFNIYLHQLSAPKWHPECHDHPWDFLAILLWRGYLEEVGTKKTQALSGADSVASSYLCAQRYYAVRNLVVADLHLR